jgi:hypothetical protein
MTTYFFDRSISRKIAAALKCLDVQAVHHDEEFDSDTEDVVWIPVVGQRNWHMVTCDDRIRRKPAERTVLEQADIVSVFFWREYARKTLWEQAEWVIKYWPAVHKKASRASPGTILHVNGRGKVEEAE